VVVAVLLFAFFVARGCQQDQVRITQEQAVATAEEQVDFTPENTQVRLLRQGLDTRPFWIVSLSIPKGDSDDRFARLALVHIDANTGKVTEVQEQEPRPAGQREGR
jgi:Peptidase propeptide and YPEB domain